MLFHDIDEDGIQGAGEPGRVGQTVELESANLVLSTKTGADGTYSLAAPVGDYTIRADAKFGGAGFCVDTFGSFNPIALDDCIAVGVPGAFTTPQELPVAVAASQTETVDFGVREADVVVFAGTAIYQTGKAEPGTVIEAFTGETKCGETTVESFTPQGIHNYEMAVYGAGEIEGCAEPGEEVTFTVNGLQADAKYDYNSTGQKLRILGLVAIEDYALYWAQELDLPGSSPPPSLVWAVIDGGLCGSTPVQTLAPLFGDTLRGFGGLAVPSAELQPGCGSPGVTVSFRVGDDETGTVVEWEPGLHMIDIDLPGAVGSGDVNCTGDVDVLDALGVLRREAGLPTEADCYVNVGDVNCDGVRDVLDALVILRFVAGLPFVLPEGCPAVNHSGP